MNSMKPIWTLSSPLVLASSSRVRRVLLERFSIPLEIVKHKVDERDVDQGVPFKDSPQKMAVFLAKQKAWSIHKDREHKWILGSDQILEFQNEIFHKISSRDELFNRLALFSEKHHTLHSAAVLIGPNAREIIFSQSASIFVKRLPPYEIEKYIEKNISTHVLDSVGGYHFEDEGVFLFKEIIGSYSSILGIPIYQIIDYFYSNGIMQLD